MNGMVCALTGHRVLPPDFNKNALYDTLEQLIQKGYTTFCCGMARGFDLTALECLVDLKQRYHVRIEACIPHAGQEKHFPEKEKQLYRLLLSWCDEKTVLFPAYFEGCYLARNRYMVEKADLVLAYCTEKTGGAAYTVRYAEGKGKEIRKM